MLEDMLVDKMVVLSVMDDILVMDDMLVNMIDFFP
jgi:hypothetical protein